MSVAVRAWICVGGGVAVMAWTVWHGTFNGANLLVIIVLAVLAFVAWSREKPESPCPHCRDCLHHVTEPTQQRRGDGV